MRKSGRRASKGFTLFEILVVVLIIGILASVALPMYFKSVEKGRTAEAISFIGTIANSEQEYLTQFGTYIGDTGPTPSNLDGLITPLFKYYSQSWTLTASGPASWTANITRTGASPCGAYTIVASCSGGTATSQCATAMSLSNSTCSSSDLGIQ